MPFDYAIKGDGTLLDPSHIYIAGFWSNGNNPFIIDTVFLSNSSEYDPPAIYVNNKAGVDTFKLTGFTYYLGAGPSESQSCNISGDLLFNNVVLNAPPNFEISLNESTGYTTSLTLAQSAGKLAQDLGCEARINLRVVPQGRAGFYGPGVELDSRTELDANLTIVPSRTGPVEVAIPDEEPEEPADEEGPVSDTNDVGDTESPDNPD